MKSNSVRSKKSLINSIPHRIRHIAVAAPLSDGPFYLVTTKKSVISSKDVEKAIKSMPENHQLVTASEDITKEAAELVHSLSGMVFVERDYPWSDESVISLNK